MNTKLPISIDILLLMVLVPAQSELGAMPVLLVVAVILCVLLEMFYPISGLPHLPTRLNAQRLSYLVRFGCLLIVITVAGVLPTLQNINSRRVLIPDAEGYSPALENLHDGALQVELGLQYLADGKNPYAQKYENTPLKHYLIKGVDLPYSPAFDYFIYLPGFLVISLPIFEAFQLAGIPYDQRWIYLLSYIVLILLMPQLVKKPESKLALMAAVGLNPFVTGPVTIGMNDVIVLLFLALVSRSILAGRLSLASVLVALACTLKQSAWFFVPFYLQFLYLNTGPDRRRSEIFKALAIITSVLLAVLGPFALWNPGAFLTDVLMYPAGMVAVNSPIRGYTLGVLLTALGVIPSPMSSFPFWILQVVFGVPFLLVLLRYQRRDNSLAGLLLTAGIFILGLGFLSRFFHLNYFGFVTALISMGVVIGYQRPDNWNVRMSLNPLSP